MYQQIDVAQAAVLPTTKEEHEILDQYHRTILEHQELSVKDKNIIMDTAASKLQKYNSKWTKKDVSTYFKNLEKKKKNTLISSNPSLIQYPQQDNAQGANKSMQMPQAPRQGPITPNPFQSAQNFVSPQNSQMQAQMQAFTQAQQKPSGKKGKNKGEEAPKVNMNPNQFYQQPNMANGDKSNQKVMMNQFPPQFAQPANNMQQMPKTQMGQMPQFNPQFQAFQAAQMPKKGKKSKDDKMLVPNQMQINAQQPQGQVQMQQPQQQNNNPFQMNNPAQPVILNGPSVQPAQTGKRKSKKEEKALMQQATMMNQQMFQFNQQKMQPMMAPNMASGPKMGFGAPMQQSQQQMQLNKTPSQMMQMQNQMQPGMMQQTPQQMMQYQPNGMMPQKVPSQTYMNIPQQPQTPPKRSPKSKRGQAKEEQTQEIQQDSLILPPEAKPAQISESPKKQRQKKQTAENTEIETRQRTRGRKPKVNESNDDDDDE